MSRAILPVEALPRRVITVPAEDTVAGTPTTGPHEGCITTVVGDQVRTVPVVIGGRAVSSIGLVDINTTNTLVFDRALSIQEIREVEQHYCSHGTLRDFAFSREGGINTDEQ